VSGDYPGVLRLVAGQNKYVEATHNLLRVPLRAATEILGALQPKVPRGMLLTSGKNGNSSFITLDILHVTEESAAQSGYRQLNRTGAR
jgi:hypothetical protein